jgi:hypothetical protein
MNKKTKTILAVALIGGVGYYMWMKSKKSSENFVNFGVNVTENCRGGGKCVMSGRGKAMNSRSICNSNGTCKNGAR